jgi:hypothetical protein
MYLVGDPVEEAYGVLGSNLHPDQPVESVDNEQ